MAGHSGALSLSHSLVTCSPLTTHRFIERVTNNVEICVTDIHCRLECGGADFHTDESKTAWPYFAIGLRVERFNMGRSAPADAKKVTTSFGIGKQIEMHSFIS
jgi:hypothetical protein